MSGFDNNTNSGRVTKMVDTLALIEKSAKSNKATPDEIAELLAPLTSALQELGMGVTGEAPAPVEAPVEAAQTLADTKTRWTPTDQEAFITRLSARDFINSRPSDNPQALMDLIHVATSELDRYLFERGDTRGGKA